MTHYICTGGCNGFSETPGTCQAPQCSKTTEKLTGCNCEDGMHSVEMHVAEEGEDNAE